MQGTRQQHYMPLYFQLDANIKHKTRQTPSQSSNTACLSIYCIIPFGAELSSQKSQKLCRTTNVTKHHSRVIENQCILFFFLFFFFLKLGSMHHNLLCAKQGKRFEEGPVIRDHFKLIGNSLISIQYNYPP